MESSASVSANASEESGNVNIVGGNISEPVVEADLRVRMQKNEDELAIHIADEDEESKAEQFRGNKSDDSNLEATNMEQRGVAADITEARENAGDVKSIFPASYSTADYRTNKHASDDTASYYPANGPCPRSQIDVANCAISDRLLGLPIDSLHSIASFLSAKDFCSFGQCSKETTKVCRDVFRRVRMHGFRCATEVVTAWKMDQHSDAKELCALYISAGVPIYPPSLGHSYHTLVWRMGIEAKEMQSTANTAQLDAQNSMRTTGSDISDTMITNGMTQRPVDRFFAERYETRAREGLNYAISYLEEKSLYMLNTERRAGEANSFAQSVRRQMSIAPNRFAVRPPPNPVNAEMMENGNVQEARSDIGGGGGYGDHLFRLHPTEMSGSTSIEPHHQGVQRSSSQSDLRKNGPKVVVKVHRHLLDQHLLGRPCVDDKDGSMTTPVVNLAADFFHPHFKRRNHATRIGHALQHLSSRFAPSDEFVSGGLLPAWSHRMNPPHPSEQLATLGTGIGDVLVDSVAAVGAHELPLLNSDDSDGNGEPDHRAALHGAENIFEPPTWALEDNVAREAHTASMLLPGSADVANQCRAPMQPNILVDVDLEVYSASTANDKANTAKVNNRETSNILRTRFALYQRRLESFLSQHDSHGFDECLLDFWDEFLPQTSNIHYYDRNTAVPRISCLDKFLTKPCPKAIGVVQCEIERIKLGTKKKGVNMKGRFFPTYEYRLFIRHRPPEPMDGMERTRRDTVLMMAKNRGRKHIESSSSIPSKKGANNYYLYVPQQEDVEQHFKNVNGVNVPLDSATNGASSWPILSDGHNLLGRLQSNFIGTEFQIFTPKATKKGGMQNSSQRAYTAPMTGGGNIPRSTEDEYAYDSGVSSDNPSSSRRKSRFGRLSLRRNAGAYSNESTLIAENELPTRSLRRSRSSENMNDGNRRTRTSRRAIADNSEGFEKDCCQPILSEEEDGAITYTANLLGSRPRIMDVCIPKVNADGLPGVEWNKYMDKCLPDVEAGTGNRMLNHLKLIQQRIENEEQGMVAQTNRDDEANGTSDYSPPNDFGLLALQNRPPWWNLELGSFVLNFGGRVSVASVKNFQLCDRNDQDYIMLQFGRIQGRHSFTMDFQHPLTAVQAFAIAISSLQSKISFG